jgi:hypothetical protein
VRFGFVETEKPKYSEYHHYYDDSQARYRYPTHHWHHRYDLAGLNYHTDCDENRDNCHLVNERYWRGYDYGPPVSFYEKMPPSVLDFTQQQEWLIQRRQRAC